MMTEGVSLWEYDWANGGASWIVHLADLTGAAGLDMMHPLADHHKKSPRLCHPIPV
jgi:hypothetical protein